MNDSRERFLQLLNERRDRPLTSEEQAFFDAYVRCDPEAAALAKADEALGFLPRLEFEVSESRQFTTKVLRKWRVERARRSFRHWSPAVAAAMVTLAAFLALLQVITRSTQVVPVKLSGSEAVRIDRDRALLPLEMAEKSVLSR